MSKRRCINNLQVLLDETGETFQGMPGDPVSDNDGGIVAYFWYHSDYYEQWTPGYSLELYFTKGGITVDEQVMYTVDGTYPIPQLPDFPRTGTTLAWDDGHIFATFTDYTITSPVDFEEIPDFTNTIIVEADGVTYRVPLIHLTYDEVWE